LLTKNNTYYLQFLPVTDASAKFAGYLNRENSDAKVISPELYVKATDNLQKAVKLLHNSRLDVIAVVDEDKHLVGTISAANIISIYEKKLKVDYRYHSAWYGDKQLLRIMAKSKKLLTFKG
jgi:Mg/Co/Ni transporter MgtE